MKIFLPNFIELPDDIPITHVLSAFKNVGLKTDRIAVNVDHDEIHLTATDDGVPAMFYRRPKAYRNSARFIEQPNQREIVKRCLDSFHETDHAPKIFGVDIGAKSSQKLG